MLKLSRLIQDLEEYRFRHRITQVKLAELLHVSFATISRWLNGRTRPRKMQEYHIRELLKKGRG